MPRKIPHPALSGDYDGLDVGDFYYDRQSNMVGIVVETPGFYFYCMLWEDCSLGIGSRKGLKACSGSALARLSFSKAHIVTTLQALARLWESSGPPAGY